MTGVAFLHGAEDLRWERSTLGQLAPNDVRISFGAGGICGSDLHYYRHGRSADFVLSSPLVLGHEVSGTVAAVGSAVTGLLPGDKVAVNPARPCGVCQYCLGGRANLCADTFFMGSASRIPHMQGGFRERFDISAEQCVKLPAETSLTAAALSEPLAVALHAVHRARAAAAVAGSAKGSLQAINIAVFGAGPIGLLILLALLRSGAEHVTIIDISDTPLSLALRLGATSAVNSAKEGTGLLHGAGFDVAIEASGSPEGLADALRSLRKGGAMVQVGNLPAGSIAVPMNLIMSKELSVLGTFRFNTEFEMAVGYIASGVINVTPLITAQVPLAEADRGFKLALDRSSNVKVMLTA